MTVKTDRLGETPFGASADARAARRQVRAAAAAGKRVAAVVMGESYDLTTPAGVKAAMSAAQEAIAAGEGDSVARLEVEGDAPPAPLTEREVYVAAMKTILFRWLEHYRSVRDETDPFDHDGAAAALTLCEKGFAAPPRDDAADICARAVTIAAGCGRYLEAQVAAGKLAMPDEDVTKPILSAVGDRAGYALQAMAAWARDGFPTYDLSATLFAALRHTLDDPAAANTRVGDLTFPHGRAFALRFPGPYPVLPIGAEARGCLVYAFDDVDSEEGDRALADVMLAVTDDDASLRPDLLLRDDDRLPFSAAIYEAMSTAGGASLSADPPVGVAIYMAGFIPDHARGATPDVPAYAPSCATMVEHGGIILRALTDGRARTLADAVHAKVTTQSPRARAEVALFDLRQSGQSVYEELLTVALGATLYLATSGDEGHPIRAKPVRFTDRPAVTPRRYVLGRGAKRNA